MTNNSQEQEQELPWLRVSYSSLNTFAFCPRKFEFNKLYGQDKSRGIDDDSLPAALGRAFHHAYQEYITTKDYDRAAFTLLRHYPWEMADAIGDSKRTWDVAMSTFEEACTKFEGWDYEIMSFLSNEGEVIPCVELPFELRFLNTALPGYKGIAFTGYIDLIMRHKTSGLIKPLDIKTHQNYQQDRTGEYMHNTQQIPYGVVVEHILGEKVEEFEVSYLDCFLSLPEPRIQEYTYVKTQQHIQEWLTAKVLQFRQLKTMAELEMFSRAESGCVSWYRTCKYLQICISRDKQNIQNWFDEIEDDPREWKPWVVADIHLPEGLV